MEIRRSKNRGHANHGWLDSYHSFSFASYWDPRYTGFRDLRVINQDSVLPGQGFGRHPHRNMEIISYVVSGGLDHRDTLGNGSTIRPGEVQLVSAGSGIAHSEYNHSADESVEFLQIWVLPREDGGEPGYQQRDFGREPGSRRLVSPDGRDNSLQIKQDTELWRLILPGGQSAAHEVVRGHVWVQIVRGTLDVNDTRLFSGDGAAISDVGRLSFDASNGEVEALVFDLA